MKLSHARLFLLSIGIMILVTIFISPINLDKTPKMHEMDAESG